MTPLYTATATSVGGREGHVKSDDGTLDLQLSVPKGLGGPGGAGSNPEQLFAAGYSACFAGALGLVARLQGVNPGPHTITAKVSIGKDATSFGLAVELRGKFSDLPREKAEQLMQAAHEVCPYSKATRGNVDVKLSVE
ncbi:MAG TPA: organic hydroperoxide resistance protein [Aggregicoccus sp.]|nr:organic hydroperoxide resistance protein [Aggregicoccus sp.]